MNGVLVVLFLVAFVFLAGYWWMLPQERQIVRTAAWMLVTNGVAGVTRGVESGVEKLREWRESRKKAP